MKIKKFIQYFSEDFYINTYTIVDGEDIILIDPGKLDSELEEYISKYNLKYILLTHGHFDHFGGILKLDVPIYVHDYDKRVLLTSEYNYAYMLNDTNDYSHKKIRILKEEIMFNEHVIKVVHTPGHTKGSVCLFLNNIVFSGDTLFSDTIGRTDLYSGDSKAIRKSLDILKTLIKSNYTVYPGHGKHALFSDIKKRNMFMK
ncbi:MBL fold metallo-hydrolase [Mycoplasmatota bacterium WC44]